MHTLRAHDKDIRAIAVSADSRRFATIGGDERICLWDLHSGKQLRDWNAGQGVKALAFTPDGKHLITANVNTTLYLLDLP